MAIDVGTTSVKCLVMNQTGQTMAQASYGYPIINQKPCWVEQDPLDWWAAVIQSIKDCLEIVHAADIASISLSGHMSALVLIDGDGQPLCPSILIADTRSAKQTSYLRQNYSEAFAEITGNEPLDAFTVSKLLWVADEKPEILEHTRNFFFPKDFIRFQLTGRIGTDPTDAGNSLLYDPMKKDWNWPMIQELDLPAHIFPELVDTTDVFGAITEQTAQQTGLRAGTPVITGGADMACSQIGTGATLDGTMAITLSTSGQVVMGVPAHHERGVGKLTFHPGVNADSMYTMGTVFTGGLGVEWGYKFLFHKEAMDRSDYSELARLTEEMKQYSAGSQGLLFLPFLVGSGTPYFDPKDRAAWIGLSLDQKKSLLLHSILEGITFNILENVNVIKELGVPVEKIHLGAGGSKNMVWCQMIADVLGMDVSPLANRDGSALGAAVIAGTGIGMFSSIEEAVSKLVKAETDISYNHEKHQQYQKLFVGYQQVYQSINRYMNNLPN
ncbi:xylulokinase [Halalkalibacter krulwichiae]|nr:xylulokinase [Halalkalibacter krulwichiae]